jgi:hypothetical protein
MNIVMSSADKVLLHPALGVGFWDTLTNTLVDSGLEVTAKRNNTEAGYTAFQNSHGLHVFHRLPGLSTAGGSDAPPPAIKRRFMFEVRDLESRFLPFTFDADCPVDGLFVPDCLQLSPPLHRYVSLYSAATRNAPAGVAVVRAELLDAVSGQPAAWAMVNGEIAGVEIARGLADQFGRLALYFAYPEPLILSPPAVMPWHWPLRLHVFYSPVVPSPALPGLCNMLGQSPAKFLDEGSSLIDVLEVDLEYGQELVVRTGMQSHLSVVAA